MLKNELQELIARGEGAKIQFKLDGVRAERLAKQVVAFANMNGGHILIGVDDAGGIVGIARDDMQEWLMDTVIGRYVHPSIIPDYEEIAIGGAKVAVLTVPRGIAKPYTLRRAGREDVYVRYGATCRLATREQNARLFAGGGLLSVEEMAVHGARADELDARRYDEYFRKILGERPADGWDDMLVHRNFLVGAHEDDAPRNCSIFACALFAKQPARRLPHAIVRLSVYRGEDKDYDASFDKVLDAPLVEYDGEVPADDVLEPAMHERVLTLLMPYISEDKIVRWTRKRIWKYPREAVRELIVNALVHRDWTKQNYIRIAVYADRMEVESPGALPNGMSVEKIKNGAQSLRNPTMARIFREYGYREDQGLGIRRKVIPLMREHNATEPEFEAGEDCFKVVLRADGKG